MGVEDVDFLYDAEMAEAGGLVLVDALDAVLEVAGFDGVAWVVSRQIDGFFVHVFAAER